MSLFGSFINDFDDDPIFGHHMRSMRQMNTMMNSMFPDPFGMFGSPFDSIQQTVPSALTGAGMSMGNQQQQQQLAVLPHQQHHHHHQHHHHRNNALMSFGFPNMSNINRLLNAQMPDGGGTSFSSSQVISMTHGPDGRPQIYKATSSTKTGPGGLRETQKTVQDSQSGVKKMAIGHHIGERSHVIEREKNLHTGEEAERQDFVNIEEDDADDFNREFNTRTRQILPNRRSGGHDVPAIMPSGGAAAITAAGGSGAAVGGCGAAVGGSGAATAGNINSSPSSASSSSSCMPSIVNRRNSRHHSPLVSARRPLRTPSSSPLALPSPSSLLQSSSSTTYSPPTISIHPHPYNASATRRANRHVKGKHHSENRNQNPSTEPPK